MEHLVLTVSSWPYSINIDFPAEKVYFFSKSPCFSNVYNF